MDRTARGTRAWLTGQAAEAAVIRHYAGQGGCLRAQRWRSQAGEIDLVLEQADEIVFCEVKFARTHDLAGAQLRPAQMARIRGAAADYLGRLPAGQLTPARFDLATVDGQGDVRLLRDAFGDF